MLRTCQKCLHMNDAATGAPYEACPSCGAIYDKVEQAMHRATGPSAAPREMPAVPSSAWKDSTQERPTAANMAAFAEQLRGASLYPTFRGLVRLFFFFWMALAVLALIAGVVVLVRGSGVSQVSGFLAGLFACLFFALVAKVTKEVALMLADLSDAAVLLASRAQQ